MNAARLHQLIERLSSLFRWSLRQTASAHGLKLVQLDALVFLSMANRYSDTAVGLSEYLGVTKGTISQTIKALERRGLIEKRPDGQDGRVVHCELTSEGHDVVVDAYPAEVLRDLHPGEADVAVALESLLRMMQRANGSRTFGICETCTHFEPRKRGGRCGLTFEDLTRSEVGLICREHEPQTRVA